MTSSFIYTHGDKTYTVYLTKKRIKSIRYRYRDGNFVVSAPYLTSKGTIIKGLDKFYDRLTNENPFHSGIKENYIYLLGKKIPISESGKMRFSDNSELIYKNKEELEKKLRKWFLEYISVRHRRYEKMMKSYENKVRVRKMFTRYGSNSIGKKSITYSSILMHYSPDVIDSVIVHELAHCFISNHSASFYKIVYKYCPNYDELYIRLRKGIYSND